MLICMLYTPLIPGCFIVGFAGMLLSYLIEKYTFAHRCRRPDFVNGLIVQFFANLLPYFLLLWGMSNFLYIRRLIEEYNKYNNELGCKTDECL